MQNKQSMPNADMSGLTSPESIAGLLRMWADGKNRPENGSFAVLKKKNGTDFLNVFLIINNQRISLNIYFVSKANLINCRLPFTL